jgi:hypothetical protein
MPKQMKHVWVVTAVLYRGERLFPSNNMLHGLIVIADPKAKTSWWRLMSRRCAAWPFTVSASQAHYHGMMSHISDSCCTCPFVESVCTLRCNSRVLIWLICTDCYTHLVLLDLLQYAEENFGLSSHINCLQLHDSDIGHILAASSLCMQPIAGSERKPQHRDWECCGMVACLRKQW